LVFQASTDQSEVSNIRTASQSVNETCPIYDGCNVTGSGTPAQAQASVSSHGCAASWPPNRGSATAFGAIAGLMALVAARVARIRQRTFRKAHRR
jgi:hypothetical protein